MKETYFPEEYIKKLFIGRLSRRNWLVASGLSLLLCVPLSFVISIFAYILPKIIFPVVIVVLFLIVWTLGFSLHVRRLHDIGKSGWLSLLTIIPFVGLFILYFLLQKGEQGNNKYGEPQSDNYKFYDILLNKKETTVLFKKETRILGSPLVTFVVSIVAIYLSSWLFSNIWISLLIGFGIVYIICRKEMNKRGTNYIIAVVVIYLISFFFLMLLLTSTEKNCTINHFLSTKACYFFRSFLGY